MNKLKSVISFLFNQHKIAIGVALFFSQLSALADIEWAVLNKNVVLTRAILGGLMAELIASLLIFPALLFSFKVLSRLKQILGIVPSGLIFFLSWFVAMLLDKAMPEPGHYTVSMLFFSIPFTLILSIALFVVKGRNPYFEQRNSTHNLSMRNCGNCGAEISSAANFCIHCGVSLDAITVSESSGLLNKSDAVDGLYLNEKSNVQVELGNVHSLDGDSHRASVAKHKWPLLIVLAAAIMAVAGWGWYESKPTFEKGVAAYEREDYVEALNNWRPFAEQGNPDAQWRLGELYWAGKGVSRDRSQAFQWFSKAADQGSADAAYILANIYASGVGVSADGFKSAYWLLKAAEGGIPEAQEKGRIHS